MKGLDGLSMPIRVSRPAAKRPGDEDRHFASRKENDQSSDWSFFHAALRERNFRAGKARPKIGEFAPNSP